MTDILNDIQNKWLRRLLKVVFFIIGITPYIIIFVVLSLLTDSTYGEYDYVFSQFTIRQFLNTCIVVGGFTLWYLLCKTIKFSILHISAYFSGY